VPGKIEWRCGSPAPLRRQSGRYSSRAMPVPPEPLWERKSQGLDRWYAAGHRSRQIHSNHSHTHTHMTSHLSEKYVKLLVQMSDLEPAVVHEIYNEFRRECPNGRLNKEQFSKFYKAFHPNGHPQKYCDHVFKTYDKDASGTVDFYQFVRALNITSQQDPTTKLEFAFAFYDKDYDGKINSTEMSNLIANMYNLLGEDQTHAEQTANKIFSLSDTNHDLRITKQEFIDGCLADKFLAGLLAPPPQIMEEP